MLSNRFESRVGTLGVLLTRVYYTLSVNGQQALNYLYQQPTRDSIEYEFRLLMSDARVYPERTSQAKSVLNSVYVGSYPLSPVYRLILEANLRTGIQRLNLVTNSFLTNKIEVLFYELYNTPRKHNVSRVYFSVSISSFLCELNNL